MAELIQLILSNIPAIMFVLAFLLALRPNPSRPFSTRLLDWMLLLVIGVGYSWAGFFHVIFPEIAARSIGWQVSPFQFEIGVADIAIGIAALLSFWRTLPFKAAIVVYSTIFCLGVAIGHVRQALAGDFAANNFGLLLVLTIIQMILLPILLWRAWDHQPGMHGRTAERA